MHNNRRAFLGATFVGMSLLATTPAFAETTAPLFEIERSTNANEVHYDVRVADDGSLNAKEPVIVYWLRKAEDGRRAGLSWIQKQMAYGFDIRKTAGGDGSYQMKLTAYGERPIFVTKAKDRWRAATTIGGKKAYLTKLFVQTKEGGILPTVLHVDLYGEDAATGEALRERIIKK